MQHAIPEKCLSQHTAILGKTGSGKTSTGKLAVEQVVGENYRVCILDAIKSDWWGITSSADGQKAGLPFKILGGPHGHVPLHSSAGAVIGKLVGSGKLPLSIIDMADFEAGGLQRFFTDFAQALMRNMRGVVYLVIEEAHEFAPKERSGIGAENMAIHWAKKLATAGRSKGIRLILNTQRVQSLHNALLGSCDTVIAHRLTTPADQEPVLKWLKANTDKDTLESVGRSLSSLPAGTGWICSGEAKIFKQVAFPKFKTYDNAATPTKDGKDHQVKTAPVDQDELRAVIGDAVKQAEANDPKKLRARIAELERASAAKPVATQSGIELVKATNRAFDEGLKKGHNAGWNDAFISIKPAIQAMEAVMKETVSRFQRSAEGRPAITTPAQKENERWKKAAREMHEDNARAAGKIPATGTVTNITAPQKRIIDAIARLEMLGVREIQKNQVAAFAGASPKSSAYTNNLGSLRTSGMIEYPRSGDVALTEVGRAAADYPETPPTVEDLHRAWVNLLPRPQGAILQALIEQYPESAPKEDLAERIGVSHQSSAYTNNLGALRSLGVLDYPAKGMVVATDILFPVAA